MASPDPTGAIPFAALVPLVVLLALTPAVASSRQWHSVPGTEQTYVLLLPDDFDPQVPHPVLLALPPGGQDATMVELALDLYWAEEATRRGWVVVSPAARDGRALHEDADALVQLVDTLPSELLIEDGALHLAGISNGGISAFRLAIERPESFASLLVAPGAPRAADAARLEALIDVPVAMFVGGADDTWRDAAEQTRDRLGELGLTHVTLTVFADEGHQPPSLTGALLFETLEQLRALSRARAVERQAVAAVLDDFHAAAAASDLERYSGHFAPGGVFLGTDASERWTVPEFRDYARPFFEAGRGWRYEPVERFVSLSRDGDVAWFDERLVNGRYGETRGSGTLRRLDGTWRIASYVLSIPVPNELAADLVERIRALDR